jgi:hypothetical protein
MRCQVVGYRGTNFASFRDVLTGHWHGANNGQITESSSHPLKPKLDGLSRSRMRAAFFVAAYLVQRILRQC